MALHNMVNKIVLGGGGGGGGAIKFDKKAKSFQGKPFLWVSWDGRASCDSLWHAAHSPDVSPTVPGVFCDLAVVGII